MTTLPPLPVFDLTERVVDDALAKEVQGIATETRFVLKWRCAAAECRRVHEAVVTARKHAKVEGSGEGLWCDDILDPATGERDPNPIFIKYDGKVLWYDRMAALVRLGEYDAIRLDPVDGSETSIATSSASPTPSAQA